MWGDCRRSISVPNQLKQLQNVHCKAITANDCSWGSQRVFLYWHTNPCVIDKKLEGLYGICRLVITRHGNTVWTRTRPFVADFSTQKTKTAVSSALADDKLVRLVKTCPKRTPCKSCEKSDWLGEWWSILHHTVVFMLLNLMLLDTHSINPHFAVNFSTWRDSNYYSVI